MIDRRGSWIGLNPLSMFRDLPPTKLSDPHSCMSTKAAVCEMGLDHNANNFYVLSKRKARSTANCVLAIRMHHRSNGQIYVNDTDCQHLCKKGRVS